MAGRAAAQPAPHSTPHCTRSSSYSSGWAPVCDRAPSLRPPARLRCHAQRARTCRWRTPGCATCQRQPGRFPAVFMMTASFSAPPGWLQGVQAFDCRAMGRSPVERAVLTRLSAPPADIQEMQGLSPRHSPQKQTPASENLQVAQHVSLAADGSSCRRRQLAYLHEATHGNRHVSGGLSCHPASPLFFIPAHIPAAAARAVPSHTPALRLHLVLKSGGACGIGGMPALACWLALLACIHR